MDRKWMRGLFVASIVLALVLMAGCGKDGRAGASYLGVWIEFSEADEIYYMSCSALPSTYSYGFLWYGVPSTATTYYATEGSWDYEYQLQWYDGSYHYSSIWSGTFTITREPGTQGGFPFRNGTNGADKYYDWELGWYGSTIAYSQTQSDSISAPPRDVVQPSVMQASNKSLEGVRLPRDPALFDIGPTRVITKSDGVYKMTITEYSCTPKGASPALPKSGVQKAAR